MNNPALAAFDDQAAVMEPAAPERFSFAGTGSEYFRIWSVNLLLTFLTLGIYSAWAKVRKLRYFYGSTSVAGASFEYHGNPVAILKGRLIAVACLVAYNATVKLSSSVGLAVFVVLMLVMPWLIWKSMQFRLFNSSYRGIRFGFRGSAGKAYRNYLLLPALALFSLYLLVPFVHQRIKKFQHEESRFGATRFSFHASAGSFYKAYAAGFLVALAGVIAIGIGFGATMAAGKLSGFRQGNAAALLPVLLFVIALYFWLFSIYPLILTMLQNLIWNSTRLGEHRFSSDMKWGRMTFIAITNVIGIVLTLGLFMPFAQIRALKYRIESMTLLPRDSLDTFIAATQAEASATGEGMADLLDFDLSL